MIGDDLTGLLGPGDGPEFGFRQGVVLSFNIIGGQNEIDVAGTVLTDIPFLNPGGYTILQPGDVVVLFRMRSSWAILGRVTTPGGTRAIGRYTEISSAYEGALVSNFSLTTSLDTKTTLDITVPVWAEVATVTATLLAQARNSTASTGILAGNITLPDGAFTTWRSGHAPTLTIASQTVTKHWQGLVTPGGTLTILGRLASVGAAWAANATDNLALLAATVAWNSNDG